MSNMNSRNISDTLLMEMKARALRKRQTLREWVLGVLMRGVEGDEDTGGGGVGGGTAEGDEEQSEGGSRRARRASTRRVAVTGGAEGETGPDRRGAGRDVGQQVEAEFAPPLEVTPPSCERGC